MICGAWLLLSIATGKVQFTDADEFSVILAKISDGQLMNTGGERSAMQHMRKFNPLNTFTSDDLNQSTFCQAQDLPKHLILEKQHCFIFCFASNRRKSQRNDVHLHCKAEDTFWLQFPFFSHRNTFTPPLLWNLCLHSK